MQGKGTTGAAFDHVSAGREASGAACYACQQKVINTLRRFLVPLPDIADHALAA